MSTLTNFFLELITVLENLLYRKLFSKINVIKRLKIKTSFSKSIFDWRIRR